MLKKSALTIGHFHDGEEGVGTCPLTLALSPDGGEGRGVAGRGGEGERERHAVSSGDGERWVSGEGRCKDPARPVDSAADRKAPGRRSWQPARSPKSPSCSTPPMTWPSPRRRFPPA